MKLTNLAIHWTPEKRATAARRQTEYFEKHPDRHPNKLVAGNRKQMTFPERLVYDWLTKRGVQFVHNAKIGRYWVDFVIGDIGIEVDGERWHDRQRDALRDAQIATDLASGLKDSEQNPSSKMLPSLSLY